GEQCSVFIEVLEVSDMVNKLVYNDKVTMFYHFKKLGCDLDNGLHTLRNDSGVLALGEFIDAIWCEVVMSLNGCDKDETIRILARRPTMVAAMADMSSLIGTNYPVALDRQDRVTTKLKTANPSLDTSIRSLCLKSVAWKITISPLTTFDLKPLILSLKLQRLQTLIISSHKCLRSQAYKTKVYDVEIIIRARFLPGCNVTRNIILCQILARALGGKVARAVSGWDIEVYDLSSKVEVLAWSAKTQVDMFKCGDHIMGVEGVVRRGSGSTPPLLLPPSGMKPGVKGDYYKDHDDSAFNQSEGSTPTGTYADFADAGRMAESKNRSPQQPPQLHTE
ncbi:hypothetical protein Tco_0105832, partial [Tanacetum coccineum]